MSDAFTAATELLRTEPTSRQTLTHAGELFEVASLEGQAEASERVAFFEAFGMARPQNWERAFDFLESAARQGSRSAREQLLLLGDDNADLGLSVDASDDFWRSVRAGIGDAGI